MGAECVEMEEVKGAMKGAMASQSTVTTLQCLLGLETATIPGKTTKPASGRLNATSTKGTSVKTVKSTAGRIKRAQPVAIPEDLPKPLSPREKYAFATEMVNSGLRVLNDAVKSLSKSAGAVQDGPPSTPLSTSREALQPRPNNITPRRPSPEKTKANDKAVPGTPSRSANESSGNIAATAECTRMAFAFLRSADTQKVGVREMPPLQLETGMLALIGKLIPLSLESMAIKELRHVKRRLESLYGAKKDAKPSSAGLRKKTNATERETLASLLQLSVRFEEDCAALNLGITYCMHTLRVIAMSRKPAVIAEVAQYLDIDRTNSPANLLSRLAKIEGQGAKAAKQLEALSQTITSLCPSPSSNGDAAAIDPSKHASPETVLKLQTIALQVRKTWWTLADHQADIDRELLEPFLRCAAAFVRRSVATLDAREMYKRLSEALTAIDHIESTGSSSPTRFNIHNLLAQQAERAGMSQESLKMVKEMMDDCMSLEKNHARKLSATVKYTSLLLAIPKGSSEPPDLDGIVEGLESKLTGAAVDFDNLLLCLHGLAISRTPDELPSSSNTSLRKALLLAAGFALRYTRSYPGRGTDHVIAIVDGAIRHSKSTDDLLSWVTADAATVFVKAGTLKKVADVASRRPLGEAWASSPNAISLSRICRALLLSKVRSQNNISAPRIFDGEKLPSEERGALLEMQLESAAQLSSKTKYHSTLRQIISDLLRALSNVYAFDIHPIRRARVAVATLQLRETCPELLPEDVLAGWQKPFDLDRNQLGSDSGLEPYLGDLEAARDVSKAFSEGGPTFDQLKPALLSWSRLIDGCVTANDLRDKIDDPLALNHRLHMMSEYLGMRGEEELRLPVLALFRKVERLHDNGINDTGSIAAVDLARCYLELGHAERAGKIIDQDAEASSTGLGTMQHQLVCAEYYHAVDDRNECERALAKCKAQRDSFTPDKVTKDQRKAYELLHAQGWLVHSKHALESGSPHEALVGAKRSVKILNSMWAALERAESGRKSDLVDEMKDAEASAASVNNLTKGVSKLNLTPKDDDSKSDGNRDKRGAAFWPLIPVLTKALMHLSDMYRHHGLFGEANYYLERAISIAESVGSTIILSRIRSHRAHLLLLAGRLDEAELCLTQDEATELREPSLAAVERSCAEAAIRTKEGSLEDALDKFEKAQKIVDRISPEEFNSRLERLEDDDGLAEKVASLSLTGKQLSTGTQRVAKAPAKRPAAKPKATKGAPKKTQSIVLAGLEIPRPSTHYVLSKIKADITLRAVILRLKLSQDTGHDLSQLVHAISSASMAVQRRVAEHLHFMAQANSALEMDVTMNVLVESTLSLPSFAHTEGDASAEEAAHAISTSGPATKSTVRSKKPAPKSKPATAQSQIIRMLRAARDCLLQSAESCSTASSTAQVHQHGSLLANASMLSSAVCDQQSSTPIHPVQQSLNIDQPRMNAVYHERQAVGADEVMSDIADALSWPAVAEGSKMQAVTTAEFQENYIDIIPKSWTAVSLCLNEDSSELYIARYRSDQQPLTLRLPFSRLKPDDSDEEAFDYVKGKGELLEIIELSNYTCHSSRNMDAKGAKSTWWSDREELDRRMHELLINMENIWFGGFKSIFARDQHDKDLLARFRNSFEGVLDRYLPSRQATKSKSKKPALDDKVLELFIGLGHDQDGVVDLDEPLSDLLYFVVDMLQFSGERNAYDEIDFDSMAVDVLDALRSYHEAVGSHASGGRHLILVLDRRLQAFPWENMPCLQGESVSRVGSMQTLRECIMAMRSDNTRALDRLPNNGEGCHVVERTSGTYILNPSSDLKATETMLSPALASLKDTLGQPWTSIVNEAPDERRFSTALQDSSVLLYFGHGAGSQYIRPRAIKRLEQCSEVVWLMGCSSGAVTENGDLEPAAVPHAYLLAGGSRTEDGSSPEQKFKCMAVLATLWDVTDKDIDRFSLRVGEEWGLFPPSQDSKLPAKTPKKRAARQIVAPSTPQQVPKTPRTPKVRKTPAPAKTPARSRSGGSGRGAEGDGDGLKRSLVQAVARGRDACYLRYLNGAATVVYGVPVYLGD